MSTPPDVALAVPFDWTPEAYDLRLTFAAGASPVDVTITAGEYRCNLAKSATAPKDFLRMLQTRIDAALSGAARAETSTVSITTMGLVTIALSAPAATWTFTATLRDALGLSSASAGAVSSVAGAYPPRGLYLFAGGDSGGWQRREPVAGALTAAGSSYGVRSGIVSYAEDITLEFIPSDPDARTLEGEVWSPWENLTATLPWPVVTVMSSALARACAFSRHWQAVRASTSETFDVVTIPPAALSKPDCKYQFPSLTLWRVWRLPLVRTTTLTRS